MIKTAFPILLIASAASITAQSLPELHKLHKHPSPLRHEARAQMPRAEVPTLMSRVDDSDTKWVPTKEEYYLWNGSDWELNAYYIDEYDSMGRLSVKESFYIDSNYKRILEYDYDENSETYTYFDISETGELIPVNRAIEFYEDYTFGTMYIKI